MNARNLFSSVVAVLLLGACASTGTAGDTALQSTPGAENERLYVALQGEAKIAVIDMTTLEEVARIDLTTMGFTANAKPHHVAVEPGGDHWYVSLIGENRVLKFDRENRIVAQAEMEVPGLMDFDPVGEMLYAGRSMSAVNAPSRIGEIRASDMDVEELEIFFPRPHALTVASGIRRAYGASLAANQMGVVNLETHDVELIQVEGPAHTLLQAAVSPDESTLVMTTEMTGQLMIFDLSNPDAPTLRRSVTVGRQPWHPVFSPDGTSVYVPLKGENAVVEVDVTSGEIVRRIESPAMSHPHGSAISPDGRWLFVSSNGPGGMQMDMGMPAGEMDHAAMGHEGHAPGFEVIRHEAAPATTGTLAIIDLETGQVAKVLEMGENATGIGAGH